MESYPILRSLDPYHARIGYLGALASIATRGLDTPAALTARFHNLLFERIYKDDERFNTLMGRVPQSRQAELRKRMLRPEQEDPSAAFMSDAAPAPEAPPADWLMGANAARRSKPALVSTDWLYVSEFWLFDSVMPAAVGHVSREKLDRPIDLARWTDVLLPTLELADLGYLLKHLLELAREQHSDDGILFNPLNPAAHACLPPIYFRTILAREILYPFLVVELVERFEKKDRLATRGSSGLLVRAVRRLLDAIGEITDPEDAPAVRDVERFYEAIVNKDSTQENYLRPRLEILVDLGFLQRRQAGEGKRNEFAWEVQDQTRLLAEELQPLTVASPSIPRELQRYLDRGFFASASRASGHHRTAVSHDDDRMLWFAQAFKEIGREFGFTPGRTLALKACLMAWERGYTMEVGDVFDAVYRAAKQPIHEYLHFSGGSRFDREFLIRVDDEAITYLEQQIAVRGGANAEAK